jgi:O-antigen/teichoic acid export membrane protein
MELKKLFGNRVVKAGSWYTVTNFFTKGIAFLTLPIFTRLLSTEDYGTVSLYNSWVKILYVIISLDLFVSVGRGKVEYKEKYNDFASSILFLSILIFFSFFIILYLFSNFLSNLLGVNKSIYYLMIFASYFTFVFNFTLEKFRYQYKYKVTTLLTILYSIASVFLSIYFITDINNDNKYLGKILGQFIPLSVLAISFLILIFYKGRDFINIKYWKFALLLSIPMIPHNIAAIINSQFDRIVIERYVGISETGIYSFVYNLSMVVTVLLNSLNSAWNPWFFEKMNESEFKNIKEKASYLRNIFLIFYSLILFLVPEIIRLMADEKYWSGLSLVPIIFLGLFFQFLYIFEVNVEIFFKKTSLISLGTILSAAINVGLNFWLVPKFGYIAAAYTTLISYMFLFIFHYIFTSKVIKMKIFGLKFHLFAIISSFSITIFFIIFQDYLFIRIIGVIGLLFLLYRMLKRFSLN